MASATAAALVAASEATANTRASISARCEVRRVGVVSHYPGLFLRRAAVYEVYPDNRGPWILHEKNGPSLRVVAWFVDRRDAECARQALEKRDVALRPVAAGCEAPKEHNAH